MAVQPLAGSSPVVVSFQRPASPASAAPVTSPPFPPVSHTDTYVAPAPAPEAAPEAAPQAAPLHRKKPVSSGLSLEQAHALVAELAPQVQALTGWPLDLAHVNIRFTEQSGLKEALLEDKRARTGVAADVWNAVASSETAELGSLNTTLGRYLPGSQTLLLEPKSFSLVNGDKLRHVIFDLLVRATQQQQHPQFFVAVDQADLAAMNSQATLGRNHKTTQDLRRVATGRHCWLVAQAETLIKRAKSEHFPHTQPKVGLRRAWRDGLALLQKPVWKRQLLQLNGPKAYACIEARGEVDAFFADPERVDALMKGCTRLFNPEKNLQQMDA